MYGVLLIYICQILGVVLVQIIYSENGVFDGKKWGSTTVVDFFSHHLPPPSILHPPSSITHHFITPLLDFQLSTLKKPPNQHSLTLHFHFHFQSQALCLLQIQPPVLRIPPVFVCYFHSLAWPLPLFPKVRTVLCPLVRVLVLVLVLRSGTRRRSFRNGRIRWWTPCSLAGRSVPCSKVSE
jgi:hypothetical protein